MTMFKSSGTRIQLPLMPRRPSFSAIYSHIPPDRLLFLTSSAWNAYLAYHSLANPFAILRSVSTINVPFLATDVLRQAGALRLGIASISIQGLASKNSARAMSIALSIASIAQAVAGMFAWSNGRLRSPKFILFLLIEACLGSSHLLHFLLSSEPYE